MEPTEPCVGLQGVGAAFSPVPGPPTQGQGPTSAKGESCGRRGGQRRPDRRLQAQTLGCAPIASTTCWGGTSRPGTNLAAESSRDGGGGGGCRPGGHCSGLGGRGGSLGPDCRVVVGGRGKEPRDMTKDWKEEEKSVWLIAGSPCSGGGKALGTTRGLALAEKVHCPAQKRQEKPALVHVSAPRPPGPRLRGEQRTWGGGESRSPSWPAHTRACTHTCTKRTGDHGPRQLASCLSEPRLRS